MQSIFGIVKYLCAKNGTNVAELERKLNFSKASVSKWDISSPTAHKIRAIAAYFNVSTDYLIGRTTIPTTADELLTNEDIPNIQCLRDNMSRQDKLKMIQIMRKSFKEDFTE